MSNSDYVCLIVPPQFQAAIYTPPVVTAPVTNGILLQNGVSFLLLQTGAYLLQEKS